MLERTWRKGNPLALLVGMYTDKATMEDCMEVHLKIKLPYDPAKPMLGIYPEKTITERHMDPRVHCNTTDNSQDMGAI